MNKKLGHDAIYDARELGIPRMLLLGLQHLFAMFGATVLVPILVTGYGLPLSIQTTLLFAGIGTLLFHICTKFKVPAFLGSSFAFLGGFQAVAGLNTGKFAAMTGEEKLPYALGGVVIADAVQHGLGLSVAVDVPDKAISGLAVPPVGNTGAADCLAHIMEQTAEGGLYGLRVHEDPSFPKGRPLAGCELFQIYCGTGDSYNQFSSPCGA